MEIAAAIERIKAAVGPLRPRLLRFARNDTSNGCHCEERSDEAIWTEGR
jgi:hypothetical protein